MHLLVFRRILKTLALSLKFSKTLLNYFKSTCFYTVIQHYPYTASRQRDVNRIVECPDFESALFKFKIDSVRNLTKEEKKCACLLCAYLKSETVSNDVQTLAEIAIGAHKGVKQVGTYVHVRFIVPTTNSFERLFSE